MTVPDAQELPELVVDVSDRPIDGWDDLWGALVGPCGLPEWFGRNLDAWWDTIQGRGISDTIDRHFLVVLLPDAVFFRADGDGMRFLETTNDSSFARAVVA
jgi:hypothetical protein